MNRAFVVSQNILGRYGAVILNVLNNSEDDKSVLIPGRNLSALTELLPGFNEVWIVGLPYWNSYRELVEGTQRNGAKVYHYASYGDTIPFADISHVDEERSPLGRLLKDLIEMYPEECWNTGIEDVVEHVNIYHTYKMDPESLSFAMILNLLSEFYGDNLVKVLGDTSVIDYCLKNEVVIEQLFLNKSQAVSEAFQRNRNHILTLKNHKVVLVITYAETHKNEVAAKLLTYYQEQFDMAVIALVGSHTKGDMSYAIRTTEGVIASEVAKVLAGKKTGKDRVAITYLSDGAEIVEKMVAKELQNNLDRVVL